jgi:hypothetical protein
LYTFSSLPHLQYDPPPRHLVLLGFITVTIFVTPTSYETAHTANFSSCPLRSRYGIKTLHTNTHTQKHI